MPNVATWQLDLNPSDTQRVLVAGTHGRGAFRLNDPSAAVPALVVSKVDAGVPVGPSSNVDYTLTLKNIGNADATGVTIKDPLPANTSFVSADQGGTVAERRRHLVGPDRSEGRLGRRLPECRESSRCTSPSASRTRCRTR